MSIATFFKGIAGELLNRIGHRLCLPRAQYHGFHNIVIPGGKGTTELDHVIVSSFGIFVVETKFWSGTIYGSEWDKRWTLFTRRSKQLVYNPLRQNFGHAKALADLLAIPVDRVGSVVAIRGAKFKTKVPKGVVLGGYAWHVRSAQTAKLDETELQRILDVLRSDQVGRGWVARLRHSWFTRARHTDAEPDTHQPPHDSPVAQEDAESRPSEATTPVPGAPPVAGMSPPEHGREAFCIGCHSILAFEPSRPMCLTCYRSSRRGTNLASLARRSCHRRGERNLGTLAKPICRPCWAQLPKSAQQAIIESLR